MSLDNAIYALSNVNALMGSTMGLIDARNNGVPTGDALMNFGYSVMNGALRNEASREIQRHTGSYLGYAVNSMAGYGNPVSNYVGTVGTIGAAMVSSPFGIFGCNPFMTSTIYGCGPFGGGFFGFTPGFRPFGCGLGIPSFFGPCGFYC